MSSSDLPKLLRTSSKIAQFWFLKVIFLDRKLAESFWFFFLWRILDWDQLLLMKKLIFKVLYFLRICPIFVSSLDNFGRSDDDMIQWKSFGFHLVDASTYLVETKTLVISWPTHTKDLEWYLACAHRSDWTNSQV